MNKILVITITGLLLGLSAPVLAHTAPLEQHDCEGTPDWTQSSQVSSQTAQLNDLIEVKLYIHPAPHDNGNNDPDPDNGQPGMLWMEDNTWDGLQKYDRQCFSTDGAHDDELIPHPDTLIV